MEDTKQLALVGNETPEQAEAIGLHYEIVSAAQAADNQYDTAYSGNPESRNDEDFYCEQ